MVERSATLGRVVVRGGNIHVALEDAPEFEVAPGDHLLLTLLYEFEDDPDEKDDVRLRLDVTLDGARAGTAEAHVRDVPLRNDSHRGALTLRARAPRADAEGLFHVRVEQDTQAWGGRAAPQREQGAASGTFRVRVR